MKEASLRGLSAHGAQNFPFFETADSSLTGCREDDGVEQFFLRKSNDMLFFSSETV